MIFCDSLSYGVDGFSILENCTLRVPSGGHVLVTGPSGAGKSTLLRLIAGLATPQQGQILLGDRVVAANARCLVPPQAREVGLVFQDLGLWPGLTVEMHLALVLQSQPLSAQQRQERIAVTLEACRLSGMHRRRPAEMSGGEQQRLALARCLAPHPRWLLLDEPFAGLDLSLKREIIESLLAFRDQWKPSMVTVSHQPMDALILGVDYVVVLEQKRALEEFSLEQAGVGDIRSQTRAEWNRHVGSLRSRPPS